MDRSADANRTDRVTGRGRDVTRPLLYLVQFSPSRRMRIGRPAANRNQSNGISGKIRHGTGRYDVIHDRRDAGNRDELEHQATCQYAGPKRVVDHPLALQQTAAAAAAEARRRWRRRRRRRRRRRVGGGGGGGGGGGRQQQSRDSSVGKSVLVRQSGCRRSPSKSPSRF